MTSWPCAGGCDRPLDTLAWGFTFEGRAYCRSCAERDGAVVHRWINIDPKRVVSDYGEAVIEGDVVVLSWPLLRHAALVGMDRRLSALQLGRKDAYGYNAHDAWTDDIEGAAAELAACIWIGQPWEPVIGALDSHDGDLGNGRQVRSTRYKSGHLPLHPPDADDHRFVLVTGRAPRLRIVGWCLGSEGKRQEFWAEPQKDRACYMVPQDALRPLPRVVSEGDEEADPPPQPRSEGAESRPQAPSGDVHGVRDDSPF